MFVVKYGFQSLIVDGKVKDKDALINALTDVSSFKLIIKKKLIISKLTSFIFLT